MKYALTLCALVAVIALAGTPAPACDTGGDWPGNSPGYWKNHFEAWPCIEPCAALESVLDCYRGNLTVLQALELKGGGQNALLRMAAAARLNACFSDYVYTNGEVQSLVCAAMASGRWTYYKNMLETW